jgi:hypothetical protein
VLKAKLRRARAVGRKSHEARAPVTAGTRLTFRAQVMPGRAANERTFTVARVLNGGRVELNGLAGEHALAAFAPSPR